MSDQKEMQRQDERETLLWRDYQRGLNYQSSTGMTSRLPEYVRFWEGKQWPAPTKNTKNLPRPVVNIVKMICRNKVSAILSARVRIVYHADKTGVDVESFNRFSDYICREIGQEKLDKRGVDSAAKKGMYIYHYYWDSEARGKEGIKTGGLRCEMIDPLNIFFANPKEMDEQKQKWIMISSRQDVSSVRAKADKGVDPARIVPDEAGEADRYGMVEQEGDELCTVLIRYFRRGGEVWCEKATKSVIVNKAFPITPDVDAAMQTLKRDDEGMDAPNNTLPDHSAAAENATLLPKRARATLYPIVVGNYEEREGSIYGIGEVEGLLPNQKAINFNLAMLLLNSQQMAWGKYVVAPNALNGQVITNEPGQTLVDHSGTGNGIRRMQEGSTPSQPLQLVETLTQLTRSVTGSSEIMTGESLRSNMSGAAIAQLQSQAQLPIEDLRENFWLVKEKQGKVLAQFFKLFYRDAEYTYEDREQKEKETQIRHGKFNGDAYANVNFEVTCEAMTGTKFSTAGDINVLDILFSKGAISLETYIMAYPDDALSNKSKILEGVRAEQQNALMQAQAQVQQLTAQMQQSVQIVEQQKQTVDHAVSAIQENGRLKALLLQLCEEFKKKIEQANQQITQGNEELARTKEDATLFAGMIDGMVKEEMAQAGPLKHMAGVGA